MVFVPELGFDALWYHLTLPKLWLFKHQWYFPGGLLYYSVMPRLAETIAIPLISVSGYVGPKLIQYFSGLVCSYLIFKLINRFTTSKNLAWVAVNLFYFTWLVSWQSSSAYIDLFRTCLEFSALYFLITKPSSFIHAGIFLGLAIGTKYHSLATLLMFAVIFKNYKIIIPSLVLSLPWFVIAYHFTGNPIYPLLTPITAHAQMVGLSPDFFSPLSIFARILFAPLHLMFPFDDFFSPIIGLVYLLSLPNIFSRNIAHRTLALVSFLGTCLVLVTPPPSSRYLLVFVPAMIVSAVIFVSKIKTKYQQIFIILALLSTLFVLTARLYSFRKNLPFILGHQTQNEFLTQMSSRLPDTFVDSDNFVQDNLKDKKILIDKLHNLYYFPYNFDHTSWATNTADYDYLVTTDTDPSSTSAKLIHTNPIGIQIYKLGL